MSNNKEGQLLNDVGCNVGEFKDRTFQKTRASDTEFILLGFLKYPSSVNTLSDKYLQ